MFQNFHEIKQVLDFNTCRTNCSALNCYIYTNRFDDVKITKILRHKKMNNIQKIRSSTYDGSKCLYDKIAKSFPT